MRAKRYGTAVVTGLLALLVSAGYGWAQETKPVAPGREVTLKANVLSNIHTGERQRGVFIIAYDGTPEIKATFEKIMAEFYPDRGLDADAARKIQDEFMTRLKYTVDGPLVDDLWKKTRWTMREAQAVTGVISEKDGRKYITVSKFSPTPFTFPAKMLAPDRPFVMPEGEPLVLKINEKLSLKCIRVPAGKFLMGEPYYQCRHWQEDPPHMVTLTKPYYMAEHPVTQEIYEAIMGDNPSKIKDPRMPVHNVDCFNMYRFCERLAAKTGRKVRVPTGAEWEYAARVGTSNPTFAVKYKDQNSNANAKYSSPPLPVKSARPNPWGFYDMHSGWWERVSDMPVKEHKDVVDPSYMPRQDRTEAGRKRKHSHMGKGQWTYEISIIEYISSEAGPFRFRVVVEAQE